MGGENFPYGKRGKSQRHLGVDVRSGDDQFDGLCGLANWTVRALLAAFVSHLILVTSIHTFITFHSFTHPFFHLS